MKSAVDRRAMLAVVCGLGAANVALGHAIAVSPGLDPVLAAISTHAAAYDVFLEAHGAYVASGQDEALWPAAAQAIALETACGKVLIETPVMTWDGLKALEKHLRSDAGANVLWLISRPVYADGFYMGRATGGEAGIDWLIDQRFEQMRAR
jgi:hypothetical protein